MYNWNGFGGQQPQQGMMPRRPPQMQQMPGPMGGLAGMGAQMGAGMPQRPPQAPFQMQGGQPPMMPGGPPAPPQAPPQPQSWNRLPPHQFAGLSSPAATGFNR